MNRKILFSFLFGMSLFLLFYQMPLAEATQSVIKEVKILPTDKGTGERDDVLIISTVFLDENGGALWAYPLEFSFVAKQSGQVISDYEFEQAVTNPWIYPVSDEPITISIMVAGLSLGDGAIELNETVEFIILPTDRDEKRITLPSYLPTGQEHTPAKNTDFDYDVPDWIKNNAKWWAEGQIEESDFLSGIEYLVTNDIMKIDYVEHEVDFDSELGIPRWIKDNAAWWADDKIATADFVNGMTYLIETGVLRINSELSPLIPSSKDEPEPTPEPDDPTLSFIDLDNDGLNVELDKCPTIPEDYDGHEDADGCPEITVEPVMKMMVKQVPVSDVYIRDIGEGTQQERLYKAYREPGSSFQIVCENPCPIDEQLIYAKYLGFKIILPELIRIAGVDVVEDLIPVSIHLNDDSFCGPYIIGETTGRAFPTGHICLWEYEKLSMDGNPQLRLDTATSVSSQLLAVHEYAHVIFFGRHAYSYETFAQALSLIVTQPPESRYYVTSLCDDFFANHEIHKLLYELCNQYGFEIEHIAPSIIGLDELYQQGLGDYHGKTTIYQYRDILNDLLNTDTTSAFVDAGYSIHPP